MSDLMNYYGTEEILPNTKTIKFNNWKIDIVEGDLKSLTFREKEVIRSIRYIIRDKNWGTYSLDLIHLEIANNKNHIRINTTSNCNLSDKNKILLKRELIISKNTLRISAHLHADEDFITARCGFTLLYPIKNVAGTPVKVVHTDGSTETGQFPVFIDPWQPFKDIKQLTYQRIDGLKISADFDGDIFEMEDQRAWMDASYKVYSRPIEKPWPYIIDANNTHSQSITISIDNEISDFNDTQCHKESYHMSMPSIGTLITPNMCKNIDLTINTLKKLNPNYILFNCNPELETYTPLSSLATITQDLPNTPIHLEYVLPIHQQEKFNSHLIRLSEELSKNSIRLECIIVCPSTDLKSTLPGGTWPWCPPLEEILSVTRKIFSGVQVGGGMLSYFTELNRKRPPIEEIDFITHSTCPIVHDASDLGVIQTLESLPFITKSVRNIAGNGLSYHLGPTMISMRDNPYGEQTYDNKNNIRITMTNSDPRHKGSFFASWLVGYLSQLIGSNIDHWCPSGLIGNLGLGILNKNKFYPYPAWQIVRFFSSMAGKKITRIDSDNEFIIIIDFDGDISYRIIANIHHLSAKCELPHTEQDVFFRIGESTIITKKSPTSYINSIEMQPFSTICFNHTIEKT